MVLVWGVGVMFGVEVNDADDDLPIARSCEVAGGRRASSLHERRMFLNFQNSYINAQIIIVELRIPGPSWMEETRSGTGMKSVSGMEMTD